MTLKQPTSIGECVYFTRRIVGKGKIKVWVFKELCPQCKQELMSKPRDPKTGKPMIRAKEYICSQCKYAEEQKPYEERLIASIEYTCPYCLKEGEIQIPFKRKKVQIFDEAEQKKKVAEALQFSCIHCKKPINITKKMK